MKRTIDENKFIQICKTSITMSEAAAKLNMEYATFREYAIKLGCFKPNQGGRGMHKKAAKSYDIQDILDGKHPGYQTYKLKNKLISAGIKQNICECCGITDWNGKPLNMELHHIDGNTSNNKLENLQILCPNCHAQTDTFRAKNKKDKFD